MGSGDVVQRLARRAAAGDLESAQALVDVLRARSHGGDEPAERVPAIAKVLAEAALEGDVSAAEALVDVLRGAAASRGPRLVAQFPTPPGRATAPGAIVLREIRRGQGESEWMTHWRNDQTGGYDGGRYFPEDYRGAVIDFAERISTFAQRYL